MYKLSLALAMLPTVFAANYTTSLLLLPFGERPNHNVVGSVIATDATATTYAVTCGVLTAHEICLMYTSFTLTQGPSTLHYTVTGPHASSRTTAPDDPYFFDLGCDITSDHGVCSGSMMGVSRTTVSGTEVPPFTTSFSDGGKGVGAQAVTIKATAKQTSKQTTTQTGEQTASTGDNTSVSTDVSTGCMPMMTGQAQWVVGGAAAAVVAFGAM